MPGGGKSQTVGYRYFMGLHFGICQGPVDSILSIKCGDRVAWVGTQTANGVISINSPGLFGGDEKEGGVKGSLEVMMGAADQSPSSYLQSVQGSPQPGYRGFLGLVFRRGLIGSNNPYVKPWAIRVRRILQGWRGGSPWYSAKAGIVLPGGVGTAMNPAHIVYECMTNPEWGLGYPTTVIDDTDFRAAADVFFAEGMGLCLEWNLQDSVESFVQVVCNHAGAVVSQDRRTGLFRMTAIRGGYTVGSLPVFDETNIVSVDTYQRPSPSESINEVTVKYDDLAEAKSIPVTVQNLASIQSQGGIVNKTTDYPGFPTGALALRAALRDLQVVSTPIAKVIFRANRSAYALRPGDLIRWTWAKLGITLLVLRVLRVNVGTVTDSTVEIEAAEDVFGLPASTYAGQQPTGWVEPTQAPAAITARVVGEVGWWEITRADSAVDPATFPNSTGYLFAVAERPPGGVNYALAIGPSYEEVAPGEFCPTGNTAAALTPIATTVSLTGIVDEELIVANRYALINTEIVRVDSLVNGLLTMGRGVLDSVPVSHAAGSKVFFAQEYITSDQVERVAAENIDAKLLTKSGGGTLAAGSAATDNTNFASRAARPYPPGQLRINSLAYPAGSLIANKLTIQWVHRSRLTQNLQGDESGSIGPEVGTTYSVMVTRIADSALVFSVDLLTGLSAVTGGLSAGPHLVEVWSVRGGLASRQRATHIVTVAPVNEAQFNRLWGLNWGRRLALPKIATLTLGGPFQAGAQIRVSLDGVPFAYTALAGDTDLTGVGTAFAAVIDASPTYVASSAAGVVTVTGPNRIDYTIAASVAPPGDPTIVSTLAQTASPIVSGNRQVLFYRFGGSPADGNFAPPSLPNDFVIEATKFAATNGPPPTYLATGFYRLRADTFNPIPLINDVIGGAATVAVGEGAGLPAALVAAGLGAGAVTLLRRGDADPGGLAETFASSGAAGFDHLIAFPQGERVIFDPTPGSPYPWEASAWKLTAYTVTGYPLASTVRFDWKLGTGAIESIPAARPQITTHTVGGTPLTGAIYTITLDGTPYSFTAIGGSTNDTIAAALASAIDAAANFVSTSTGPVVTVTRSVVNTAYTFAQSVTASTTTITPAVVQAAQ